MISDLSSKLSQVIGQIPKNVLYGFLCSYAQEHEELAMALVNEFWRPEKDDYRSMVSHQRTPYFQTEILSVPLRGILIYRV